MNVTDILNSCSSLLSVARINSITKSNIGRNGFIQFTGYSVVYHQGELRQESEREAETMENCCFLACSLACIHSATCLRLVHFTVESALLDQLTMKAMPHSPAHRPV